MVGIRDAEETEPPVATRRGRVDDWAVDESLARRVLWLATRMIHEANVVRPNPDGLKVGGHQASTASVVSILSALYFRWLTGADLVSIKPHASPAYHAIQYLLGGLDASFLTKLRAFGGLQAYPSRSKDPDGVDFSTGSVGLGAVAPLYAALADQYLRRHFVETMASLPRRRFVAVIGDAELDEGNVWESVLEDSLAGLGNVTLIVDLNRQSLDRVVPGIRSGRLQAMFAAAGWHVLEAKYGRRLERAFRQPGGSRLRRRIDAMSNEEFQALIRRDGPTIRHELIAGSPVGDRDTVAGSIGTVADADIGTLLRDLGGHDIRGLVSALDACDSDRTRPSVLFAYTIKGWGLPFAGDPMNHSALLADDQIRGVAVELGADVAAPWARPNPRTPEGRRCSARATTLGRGPSRAPTVSPPRAVVPEVPWRPVERTSTQQAFGDALAALARLPTIGNRVVTAAPDVTVSTSLGGWVSRVGVFSPTAGDEAPTPQLGVDWRPRPSGRHIELGISEMNLFMWLSQFGLTQELFGERLIPIGTVYDPFVCRGLDAFIYALYVRSRFIVAGTPSGVTLAPEGGAHQSTITSSIGIELPGIRMYEPAFGREVAWILTEAVRGVVDPAADFSTYLRLSTRMTDQSLTAEFEQRVGMDTWHRQVLSGGYRLIDPDGYDLPPNSPRVDVVAMGSVVPDAIDAVKTLIDEEVAAGLVVISSAERLSAQLHDTRLDAVRTRRSLVPGYLDELFPASSRWVPMVTVADGASHALGFIGSINGSVVVPLGVDEFGQSGRIQDVYGHAGIDAAHILEAALLAIELEAADARRSA